MPGGTPTKKRPGQKGKGKNPDFVSREKFAQAVAAGKTLVDAYREAKPAQCARSKPDSVRRMAVAWNSEEWTQERIAEIKAAVAERAVEMTAIDKTYVMKRLHEIAERCMQHEPVKDKKGEQVYTTDADGGLVAAYVFNAAGAKGALELLGKEIGMFVDRKEIRTGSLDKLTDAELTRLAQEFAAQCGFTLGDAGDGTPPSGEPSTALPTIQ